MSGSPHDSMLDSRRRQLALVASIGLAAVPVAFGIIRAVSTGSDLRYLWLAGAAIVGSMAVVAFRRGGPGAAQVSMLLAAGAIVTGAACAAAAALLMGTRAGPGLAVVALAFGLCTGASAVCASLARRSPVR
jgi:hypothetical protein